MKGLPQTEHSSPSPPRTPYRIPSILSRRRLNGRYTICTAIASYVLYCYLTSQLLFVHMLPNYTGPHPVGTIDIEAPVSQPRIIHNAKLKATGEPAFKLDTVLFTLYYPATDVPSTKPAHDWVPKPVELTAVGYARFAHISNYITNAIFTGALKLLVGDLTVPAKVDVPLGGLPPQADLLTSCDETGKRRIKVESETDSFTTPDGRYPVLVFSHGMASSRTDYTQYCGELASRGYVVAAIEHRDGSCPSSVVIRKGKPEENILHFDLKDVVSDEKMDISALKKAQLAFRQAEIGATVEVIQAINAGRGHEIYSNNPNNEGADLPNWAGHLSTEEMILGGHSYGATGALQALKADSGLPFKGGIILDPGKSSGPLNAEIDVPIMVVHSNSWSAKFSIFYGRPHFDVVKDLVQGVIKKGKDAWFLTSLGTSHPSVTDAPLIAPLLLSWTTGSKIDVHEGLRQYVHVSEDFMWYLAVGEKRNLLREKAEFPEYDAAWGYDRYYGQARKGFKRYWQVHVSPERDGNETK